MFDLDEMAIILEESIFFLLTCNFQRLSADRHLDLILSFSLRLNDCSTQYARLMATIIFMI